jgi:hypothetical protein
MSDEQLNEDSIDVEGHSTRFGVSDEPAEDAEDEIEAHVHRAANVRMDSPSNT